MSDHSFKPSADEPSRLVVVEQPQHGMQLADFLGHLWPAVDRTVLRRLVLDGCISINADEIDKPRHRLKTGDVVQIALPHPEAALKLFQPSDSTATPAITVLYEDDTVLVVDKPAGIGAGRDKTGRNHGVLDQLIAARGDPELRLVYRPDRDASGCLVIAKTLAAARTGEASLAEGRLTTEYVALVHGAMRGQEYDVDRALGPDRRRPGKILVVESDAKGARQAVSHVAVEEAFWQHTLVRVRPMTWRNHQIRVHLGFLGHPIVADPDYGVRDHLLLSEIKKSYKARPGVVERPLLERMFLHIERVRMPDHAGTGCVTIDAPLPKDLAVVLAKLRSFAAK